MCVVEITCGNCVIRNLHIILRFPLGCAKETFSLYSLYVYFLLFFFNYAECAYINPFFFFYYYYSCRSVAGLLFSRESCTRSPERLRSGCRPTLFSRFSFRFPLYTCIYIYIYIYMHAPSFEPFCSSIRFSPSLSLSKSQPPTRNSRCEFVAVFVAAVIRFNPGWWGD